MKKFKLVLIVILSAFNLSANDDNLQSSFSTLSIKDFEVLIARVERPQQIRDYVNAAIHSGRIEMVKICFENLDTCHDLLPYSKDIPYEKQPIGQIKDENFRDDIVVMMLAATSLWWPEENLNPLRGSSAGGVGPKVYMREPFVSTIKKNLPDLPLTEDLLITRAARLKLAENIKAAIEQKKSPSLTQPIPMVPKAPSPNESPKSSPKSVPAESLFSSFGMWALLVAVLVLAACWFKFKRS